MVRNKRILFVIALCLLMLFGLLSSASAALPVNSLSNCASAQCIGTCNTQCDNNAQQPALASLLSNCTSSQCLGTCNPQCGANVQQPALASLLSNCTSSQCLSTC